MTFTLRRTAAGIAAALLAGGVLLTSGGTAHATTPPPWEAGGGGQSDPNEAGGLLFFNSSGVLVTGGDITAPISATVEGSKTLRAGDSSGNLYGRTPTDGVPPGSWSGEQLAGPTAYPDVSAPAAVSRTLPLVEPGVHDLDIADFASDYPNTDTSSSDGYAGIYQLRLYTTGSGAQSTTYDSADIEVTYTNTPTDTTGTWSVVYSNTQVATSTSLAVSPSASTYNGGSVKLTASISPSTAAGAVEFLDGTKLLKTVAVSSGKATYSTAALADATHKLKATFVPTDTTAFAGSSSSSHSLVVKAHPTTLTLKASKSSIVKGKKLTLTVKEAPAVAGKVTFYDGTKKLATVKVAKGKATYSTTKLKVGTHKLKAKFAPTSTAADAASSSKVVKVKVKK